MKPEKYIKEIQEYYPPELFNHYDTMLSIQQKLEKDPDFMCRLEIEYLKN